jgi:uncharacterized protein (DUF2336 family)
MSRNLSVSDVRRLLEDPSPAARAETAIKAARTLDESALGSGERAELDQILRLLARDAEVLVRQSLAEHVKVSTRLPPDVALTLARDIEAVALPILEFSTMLADGDLIAIVRDKQAAKQIAIAKRRRISAPISEALITDGVDNALSVLAGNNGATIAPTDFNRLVDRASGSEAIQTALVGREHLPPAVMERMFVMVSEKLREQLLERTDVSPALAGDLVLHARERATVGHLSLNLEHDQVVRLVRHLQANKRLTPTIVVRALCMGDLDFFEAAVALMAQIPLANAIRLIHDPGTIGLHSVYVKAGLPMRYYRLVRGAIDIADEMHYDGLPLDRERYHRRMIERVLTQNEDLGDDTREFLLSKLDRLPPATRAETLAPTG